MTLTLRRRCAEVLGHGSVDFRLAVTRQGSVIPPDLRNRSQSRPSLYRGVVVITDDPCDFPRAIFVLPQMNKFPFAHRLRVVVPRMVETVNAHLHRSVAFQTIDLQRPWNDFAGHFSTDVVL